MRILHSEGIHPVIGTVGAAIFFATWTDGLASQQLEIISELLCWMLLPVLFEFTPHQTPSVITTTKNLRSQYRQTSPRSLWIVAVGFAIACVCRAEHGTIEALPTLTPLLAGVLKWLDTDTMIPNASPLGSFSSLVTQGWGTLPIAFLATFTVSNGDPLSFAISCVAVAALLLAYVGLSQRRISSRHLPSINHLEDSLRPLSVRVVALLAIALSGDVALFGLPEISTIVPALALSATKAASWYFMVRTTQYTSWNVIAAIATYSLLSSRNFWAMSSETEALSHLAASFLVLGQIIFMLPEQAKARSSLWLCYLLPLAPYAANLLAIRNSQSVATSSFASLVAHPVQGLIDDRKDGFAKFLDSQSTTYEAACDEYRRRYDFDPPVGFQGWYEYAVLHGSRVIDDFDVIHKAVAPFWKLSGAKVREIMKDVQSGSGSELWRCKIPGANGKAEWDHPFRFNDRHIGQLFDLLFDDPDLNLPNVTLLINHLDEPTALLPSRLSPDAKVDRYSTFTETNLGRRKVWHAITKQCGLQPTDDNHESAGASTTSTGISFVDDVASNMDLCQHPEYRNMHGLLIKPTSFRLIEGFVPILSTGSLSTMGDILFPSPAYLEPEFQYDGANDIEWESKRNNLYWAGSSTGGFASDSRWKNYHRQRFVTKTQNLAKQSHYYLRQHDKAVEYFQSSFLNGRLFDVAFTKMAHCRGKHCRDQRAFFHPKAWAHKDQGFRSRLVFDIDGNGISGRFYKLLASKSLPLKQTLMQEWHDDRVKPWVHYIPVTQGMEELPELVTYLTSNRIGQEKARQVAEQGRDWYFQALRTADFKIYLYRLMLELARLQDPARTAS